MISTDETLLERVRRTNAHEAWKVFYDLYWPSIHRYGRKLGLSDNQAEEVLQDTMVVLMRQLPDFTYDRSRGRFRNFLLTIVHRKALGVMRRHARERARFDLPAEIELLSQDPVQEEHEELWRESVVASVLEELRSDPEIDPRMLRVFDAYVVQRRSGRDVAAEFGISENLVHQTKSRLLRRLRVAVQRRLADSGSPAVI